MSNYEISLVVIYIIYFSTAFWIYDNISFFLLTIYLVKKKKKQFRRKEKEKDTI